MALKVIKKDRESPQELVYRFTKTVRQSGVLLQTRAKQFYKKSKSHLAKKRSALRKVILIEKKKKEAKMAKPK